MRVTASRSRGADHPGACAPAGAAIASDLVGAGLFAAAIAWTFLSAALSGGDALPAAASFLAAGCAFLLGRAASRSGRFLAPAAVMAIAVALALGSLGELLDRQEPVDPLGYANANAALLVQGVAGALMLARAARGGAARGVALAGAGGLALLVLLSGSLAADVLLALPVAALAARSSERTRLLVSACLALFVLTLIGTVALGAARSPQKESDLAGRIAEELTLSELRADLWHDALRLMLEHPVTGVGPGRFELESPTAREDVDARWAHHGFLQQGAEGGVVGFALLVLIFLWGFGRLRTRAEADSALGAAALAALGIHSCVDYVLHFTLVPVAAAALVGAACGRREHRSTSEERIG